MDTDFHIQERKPFGSFMPPGPQASFSSVLIGALPGMLDACLHLELVDYFVMFFFKFRLKHAKAFWIAEAKAINKCQPGNSL